MLLLQASTIYHGQIINSTLCCSLPNMDSLLLHVFFFEAKTDKTNRHKFLILKIGVSEKKMVES